MSEKTHPVAWLLFGGAVGFMFAWILAHGVVSQECDKLGGFFVGEKVYRCIPSPGQGGEKP